MIQLNHIHKSFQGHKALNDLSLAVNGGDIYGLLGANGAGKSTTLNLILGFLEPDEGEIQLSTAESSPISNRELGYIPENVNLYPYLSGTENLDYFCKLAGLRYSAEELSGFLRVRAGKRCTWQASCILLQGMRQKVGIAIAYAKKAQIYLLDEPASGLDPVASKALDAAEKAGL